MTDRPLTWGKGIKKLVDRVLDLGYSLEIQDGMLKMEYIGKCPPFQKTLKPLKHAIYHNKDAVIQYLHFRENIKKGGESQ
jgi:hypothetical protein